MPESARKFNHAAEVEGFLKTLFEGQEGFVYAPTKNPTTGHWQTYFFTFPQQRNDIVTHMMDATKSKEVYLSPSLFSAPDAKQGNWKGSNYVWTEFDGNAPRKLPQGIPEPTIVVQSSTPGHEHWYWRLNEFESSPEVIQGLSKQLTYTLDADKSAWDSNQVLRPPGTLHHDSKHRVRLLSSENRTVSLSDFVGLVEAPADVVVNTNITSLRDIQDIVSAYKWPTDARDLFKKAKQAQGNRSSAMTRMAFHCIEMGMSNEDAYVVLLNCDDRWGKFKNRTPESRVKVLTGLITHVRNKKGIQAEQRLSDYVPVYNFTEIQNVSFEGLPWLFSNIIAETSWTVLAADPGVGKSTLAIQMGLSVALGKKFLNWEFGLKEGMQVGFFSYEMDVLQCQHFISQMAPGYTKEEQQTLTEKFHVQATGYAVTLDKTDQQQEILDVVDKHDMKFVIIDSLKAVGAMEEKKFAAIELFVNKELRKERGCTVLMIHHNRKPPQEGHSKHQALADLYGDVFIQATAVHVIGLRSKQDGRLEIAQTKNRLAAPMKTFLMKRTQHLNFIPDDEQEVPDVKSSVAPKPDKFDSEGSI
jgi:hypothetical protein